MLPPLCVASLHIKYFIASPAQKLEIMGNNDNYFVFFVKLPNHIADLQHPVIVQTAGRLVKDKYICYIEVEQGYDSKRLSVTAVQER